MVENIRDLVIVGGGSAGWMTAAYLNRALGDSVRITLIESPNISTIGVGEATFSTIKLFFDYLDLEEHEWMPSCQAAYKLAIKFVNWNAEKRHFYHPFQRYEVVHGFNLGDWWLKMQNGLGAFDYASFVVPAMCDHKRSPRYLDGTVYDEKVVEHFQPERSFQKNVLADLKIQYPYAYHFNAALLAKFLCDYATERGVQKVLDDVTHVQLAENGDIAHIATKEHGNIVADLFVDCTGFRGLLINKTLGEPFLPFADSLLCDSAVAVQVPRDIARDGIQPYTTATALSAGWVWNIPLYGRDGTGYVYSSAFLSKEQAEKEFREHLGPASDGLTANHIRMRVGRNRNSWVKNCVAIGLSSGFVEPLESTGIFFIQHGIEELVAHLPNRRMDDELRNSYNRAVAEVIDGVREFLTLHYCTSTRTDTPFWKATKTDIKVPECLAERLRLWKYRMPVNRTIYPHYHGFESYSYSVMLIGLGFRPECSLPVLDHMPAGKALAAFRAIRERADYLCRTLPSQYEYLANLHQKSEFTPRTKQADMRVTANNGPTDDGRPKTRRFENIDQHPFRENPPMDYRIKDVVILGGGTAGWMTAAYLGKALQGNVRITVLEAPSIPKIGVGEATVPNLQRVFFDYLGLKEDEWMRECNAAFKTAIKYINWHTPGEGVTQPRRIGGKWPDQFYHPFGLLPFCDQIPLSHYWVNKRQRGETDEPFDYACFRESVIMDHNLAPRYRDGQPATYYAWHFDAHLVADFLRRFATTRQGVIHICDELEGVNFRPDGFIASLKTKSGRILEGDLFVDCSGFRGLLINKAMGEPFVDMSDYLLTDGAIAAAVPNNDERDGIEPFTSAIAMKAGWTWKIPMLTRHGTGYVYSSKFTTQDEATQDFCRLWNLDPNKANLNKIRFRTGRNRRSWVKNCVGIGLSSFFLEPLESTGIYFITAACYQLAKHFPDKRFDQILIDRFNWEVETMFDDCRDFIQAHFYFARRNDTPFWKAVKDLRLAPGIQEKIAMYRAGMPVNPPVTDEPTYYENFDAELRNFWTNGSYYCIFAGLGFLPEHSLPLLTYKTESIRKAEPLFARVKQQQRELLGTLPTNYEFLRNLHGTNGSKVRNGERRAGAARTDVAALV